MFHFITSCKALKSLKCMFVWMMPCVWYHVLMLCVMLHVMVLVCHVMCDEGGMIDFMLFGGFVNRWTDWQIDEQAGGCRVASSTEKNRGNPSIVFSLHASFPLLIQGLFYSLSKSKRLKIHVKFSFWCWFCAHCLGNSKQFHIQS